MGLFIEAYVPWFRAILPANNPSICSLGGDSPGGHAAKASLGNESTRFAIKAVTSSAARLTSRTRDLKASFDLSKVPMTDDVDRFS